jgi:hypothetical protein
MKNQVYNGPFGKLLRTIGFLAVLVGSLYLATKMVLDPGNAELPLIGNLTEFANLVNDQLTNVTFLNETAYVFLILSGGFILLTWVLRNGLILRVLLTVLLAVNFIFAAATGDTFLAQMAVISPDWLIELLQSIDSIYDEVVALSDYLIPGVALASAFFLWVLFAYKKPGRLSTFVLRMGTTSLFVAILMNFVANAFMTSLLDLEIFMTVMVALYLVTYLLFLLGSALGVLGFTRK